MGKFLKILGIIFLILIVLIVVGLLFGHSKSDEKMQDFYDIIATNNPQMLLDECSPEFGATIDPPVLELWMKSFNTALGSYEGLSGTDFNINYNSTNGQDVLTINGTANFEKGQAKTFIEKINGKITDIQINSEQFKGDDWLTEPPTDFYKDKAIKFLSLLTDNPPKIEEAKKMLIPAMNKLLPPKSTQKGMENFLAAYGDRKSLEMTGKKFEMNDDDGNRSLTLFFRYTGQKQSCDAYVKFAFNKLGSIIYAFLIPSSSIESNTSAPAAAEDKAPIPTGKINALFNAIASQNPAEMTALCRPELSQELDTPILAAWMKAFNTAMGKLKSADNGGLTSTKKTSQGNTLLTVVGKVDCVNGPVDLNLRYLNEKLISFDISSQQIKNSKWFQDVNMSYCKAKGKDFLRHLVSGDAQKAAAMMMPKLREKFTHQQIENAMKNFTAKYGLPSKLTVTNTQTTNSDNTQIIKIDYDYTGQQENCSAYVKFAIIGLKAEVVGFNIPADK